MKAKAKTIYKANDLTNIMRSRFMPLNLIAINYDDPYCSVFALKSKNKRKIH
jgi:DNA-binding protein